MPEDFRWTETDRAGNEIYLTDERWQHIIDPMNHPEMNDFENELRETVRLGRRKQEMLAPQKYRYSRKFENLISKNTHIVAIVVFRLNENDKGEVLPNNFIVSNRGLINLPG